MSQTSRSSSRRSSTAPQPCLDDYDNDKYQCLLEKLYDRSSTCLICERLYTRASAEQTTFTEQKSIIRDFEVHFKEYHTKTVKKRPAPPSEGEKLSPPVKTQKDKDTSAKSDKVKTPANSDSERACAMPNKQSTKKTGTIPKKSSNEFQLQENLNSNSMNIPDETLMPPPQQAPPTCKTPTKHVNLRDHISNNDYNVTTRNRFDPLSDEDTEEEEQTAASVRNKAAAASKKQQPPKSTKPATPPPIVIVGNDNNNIMNSLDQVTSGDYWVKYTANSIIVHTKNIADYQAVIRACDDVDLCYHTYSAAGRKTHAFVLRGLAKRHEPADIIQFIKDNSTVAVEKVFKMKTLGAPLFLVVTDSSWTIAKLNRELPRILRVSVQWENRRNANPITQCRRCQLWGHSMGNCRRPIRCSKCAESHQITECTHVGDPTCANCKGKHRAFSRDCPVYLSKLSQYYEKFPPTNQNTAKATYVAAPAPLNPAWNNQALSTGGPAAAPPTAPPPAMNQAAYSMNFPSAPGQRRNQQPRQSQQNVPTAPPASASNPTSTFQILTGKWNEINSLINLDNMVRALDTYASMLRSAASNEDLFNISREFFCNILPSINLRP